MAISWGDREGAAAIEFAILAVPFVILVFAIFETFIAFAGEQLLANAVDTMARKIRTGNITFGQGTSVTVPSDMAKPSSFLVHSEISLPYTLLLYVDTGASISQQARTITLTREFYYRQRQGSDVVCGDCS